MTRGNVFKTSGKYSHTYVVVNDYGTLRPLNLDSDCSLDLNSVQSLGLSWADAKIKNGFYEGDVLIADTLDEFIKEFWL